MKRTGIALLLLVVVLGCTTTITPRRPQPKPFPFPGRLFEHVLIVVLENEDQEDVLKNPYMKALAGQGASLSDYNGLFHPSYPNYLALVAGDFFHTQGDNQKDISSKTIADLLEPRLTWKQYAENFPGSCFKGDHAGNLYARKHVPFMSFTSIQDNKERCRNVVSADPAHPERFDRHHLPNYAFFSPNMDDDGHDTSLSDAAQWLQRFLDPILADPGVMNDTLIVVTFDESAAQANNHIYTVLLGNMVKKGCTSNLPYDHYNLLRTIEDNFGIGTLGTKDQESSPITGIWESSSDAPCPIPAEPHAT